MMKYIKWILFILFLSGCSALPKKAVVVEIDYPAGGPIESAKEATINVIHNVRSIASLKSVARIASKNALNCDSGKMSQEWLDEKSVPVHIDFPEGQNSVSVKLKRIE